MSHPMKKQVKRFVASNMSRALEMVREEMGPEAVILSSQRTDRGVEIVTSLDPDLPTRGVDVRREFGQNFDTEIDRPMDSDPAWRVQAGVEKAAATFGGATETNIGPRGGAELAKEIERAREKMLAAKRAAAEANQPLNKRLQESNGGMYDRGDAYEHVSEVSRTRAAEQTAYEQKYSVGYEAGENPDKARLHVLENELADMRMLLEQQLWQMADVNGAQGMSQQVKMPNRYTVIEEHLTRLGLQKELIVNITRQVKKHKRVSHTWRDCVALLSKQVPVVDEDLVDDGGIFCFVGQTGVGKTTTIAKLAARYVLEHGAGKVALVTTDTYRVGAYDQLRSLGRILNVPVRAVDAENSLKRVLASLKDFPLVLVDTAGFRHGDPLLKEQLKRLDSCPSIKKILVLSCNSQIQTMKASVHAYSSLRGINACVLSKLDESASLGEAISVIIEKSLPVAYFTDGQEIPRDISRASGHAIVAKATALLRYAANDATEAVPF